MAVLNETFFKSMHSDIIIYSIQTLITSVVSVPMMKVI